MALGAQAVRNVGDAVRIADAFVSQYFPYRQLNAARRGEDGWYVEFEAGIIKTGPIKVTLDDDGNVVAYQRG
jgi:hypothetical protein